MAVWRAALTAGVADSAASSPNGRRWLATFHPPPPCPSTCSKAATTLIRYSMPTSSPAAEPSSLRRVSMANAMFMTIFLFSMFRQFPGFTVMTHDRIPIPLSLASSNTPGSTRSETRYFTLLARLGSATPFEALKWLPAPSIPPSAAFKPCMNFSAATSPSSSSSSS
eukprot:12897896-Prorocentrum_lima.AAC.2